MIHVTLHRLALPLALALSLGACGSTSDKGISGPAPPPVTNAPASPPRTGVTADAPPPVVDPAPTMPPSSSVSPPMGGAMTCDAGKGQAAIGQRATQAMVDRTIADTGSRNARVIRPDQPVTMDYREDRVNIHVDANNVILSVRCG